MTGLRWTRALTSAAALVALTATAGCGDSDPLRGTSSGNNDPNSIVVGSANFPEPQTIAEIYAAILRVNGFAVHTRLGIGSREAYIPAVRNGSVDLLPDYTGNLLRYLDPDAEASDAEQVYRVLSDTAAHTGLAVGPPAPAEDSDAVVVTETTAQRWRLHSIADLAPHSDNLKFGAAAEFAERPDGLAGLKRNYGVDVSTDDFVPIADGGGPATVKALTSGQVNVANIYTTSPALEQHHLVVLTDPKHNFPAQNVVAVFNAHKKSARLTTVLKAVADNLTTAELIALNQSVSGDTKTEPAAAAAQWVAAHGLDKPLEQENR